MPNSIVFSNPGASIIRWGDGVAAPYLTLSGISGSPLVGVPITGYVTNTGSAPGNWSIASSPADVLISPSSGTVAVGAQAAFTLTALAAGIKSISLSSSTPGATIAGSPMSFSAISAAPPPPSGNPTPFLVARTGTRYATLAQAVAGAISGDTIKVASGTYVIPASPSAAATTPGFTVVGDTFSGIQLHTLTIEWETPGVMPIIDLSLYAQQQATTGGRAIGISAGNNNRNLTIRGLHLIGHPADPSGGGGNASYGINSNQGYTPGVGFDGSPAATLTIDQCKLARWGDGVKNTIYNRNLTTILTSTVIEDCSSNDKTHGIYVNGELLSLRGCTIRTTVAGLSPPSSNAGHLLKSRTRATTVEASLFDPAGGCATCIETPSGGALTVEGNIILHYGQLLSSDDNPPIKYGFEESALRIVVNHGAEAVFTVGTTFVAANGKSGAVTAVLAGSTYVYSLGEEGQYVSTGAVTVGGLSRGTITSLIGSPDGSSNDGRTHSILIAQNTIRKDQPGDWSGNPSVAFGALWVATNMTTDAGVAIPPASISTTVRNNIIGDQACGDKTIADGYTLNSAVARSTISNTGVYSGANIAGNPLVNDAAFAWTADFTAATARTDTFRGGLITGYPAWRAGQVANTWRVITTSTIADVDPASNVAINPSFPGSAPWRGSDGQTAVLDAWGTFCLDDGTLDLYMTNGGHGNYAGNEVYKIGLSASTPAWTLARNPTGAIGNTGTLNDGLETSGVYFDGRPRSSHSYNNNVSVPGVGMVMTRQAFNYSSANSGNKVFWFRPSTQDWVQVANLASISGASIGTEGNAACCYDSSRNRIVGIGLGNVHVWYVTPDNGSTTWVTGFLPTQTTWNGGSPSAMVYIPTIDRYLHVVAYLGTLYHKLCHPTTGALTDLGAISGSLASGFDFGTCPGVEWSPELNKVLLFNQASNTTQVSTLTYPGNLTTAWTGGTITVSGANAVTPALRPPNGTFGMARYSSRLKGIVYQTPWVDKKLYFYATE